MLKYIWNRVQNSGLDWCAQYRIQWQAFMKMVINLLVPWKREILTDRITINCSRKVLYHRVSDAVFCEALSSDVQSSGEKEITHDCTLW